MRGRSALGASPALVLTMRSRWNRDRCSRLAICSPVRSCSSRVSTSTSSQALKVSRESATSRSLLGAAADRLIGLAQLRSVVDDDLVAQPRGEVERLDLGVVGDVDAPVA